MSGSAPALTLLAFELLVLVCLLAACDSAAASVPETLAPPPPPPTASSQTVAPTQPVVDPSPGVCGVGILGAQARVWIEGADAQRACGSLMVQIRQEGNQPVSWDGAIILNATDYRPVCAGMAPNVTYEVIDTGAHLLGTTWCHWAVQQYGAANPPSALDIFGIVGVSQQTEVARQHGDMATSQAIATAKWRNDTATQAARQQAYAIACAVHGGYLENGFCMVDYPGSPKWRITINYDGTWNAAQADANRKLCESAAQQAARAAQAGQTWTAPPQYHDDTGVCIQGHP